MGDVLNRGTKDRPRWYCRYVDSDGKRKQRKTGQRTKAGALRYLAEVEERVAYGKIGVPEPTDEERQRETVTLATLADRFLGRVAGCPGYSSPRLHNLDSYRAQARSVLDRRVLPVLGDKVAASVTRNDCERLRDALAKRLSPESVCHTLIVIGKVYRWAKLQGFIGCDPPTHGVERTRGEPLLDYLDAGEAGRLLSHLAEAGSHQVEAMVSTALFAGLRRGELYGLTWQAVDLQAGLLGVLHSYAGPPKNGRSRWISIHPSLAVTLRGWRERCPSSPEGLVFPLATASGALRMGTTNDDLGLGAIMLEAKCRKHSRPWHALRHTFASNLVMAGQDLYTVGKLLGHSSPEMTAIYAHLSPAHLANAIGKLTFAPTAVAGVVSLDERRRQMAAEAEAPGDDLDHPWTKKRTPAS